ncbi:hypothetical protein BCAR13_520099 [Paraburkholderia caribensis]|nr:hypothetical protein BCAR13_520099 [Paraburkholderia caribensis]
MTESEFLKTVADRTGCGLLLDLNNVFVSATNHGYDARTYLEQFPLDVVGEIHLAGHAEQLDDDGDRLLIDSHDRAVSDAVWNLYEHVIEQLGPMPTLIEWDSDLPEWKVLWNQVMQARMRMMRTSANSTEEAVHDL